MGDFGSVVSNVQGSVLLVLVVASIGLKGFAVIDAVRYKPEAYVAAGKRTKNFWLAIVGVALLVNIVLLWAPLSFLNIAGVIAAAVYLVDVRPALRQVTGQGGSTMGPYGPY